jgi:hypothetical protein
MHATWTGGYSVQQYGGGESSRVLLWALVGGSRLEVVQSPDEHLAILRDGEPVRQWAWGARDVEACTRTFLRMTRGGRLRPDN